jgi:hypothetical protein
MDSYDRLFPNQDTIPKGGFGNLIALPLQKEPVDKGNSLFLDSSFTPYQDQWAFLASIERVKSSVLGEIVHIKRRISHGRRHPQSSYEHHFMLVPFPIK